MSGTQQAGHPRPPHPEAPVLSAPLPDSRGELSGALVDILQAAPSAGQRFPEAEQADPCGDDLQLALHICYELHYHGFAGVVPGWEWEPELLRFRANLERPFLDMLRRDVKGGNDVADEFAQLLLEPVDASGIAAYIQKHGQRRQLREYFVHRSIYHHKEGDPHAWVIPRLFGQEKASLVAVEFDEFGGGRGERMHARLYADLLTAADLHDGYLHYLNVVPAPMLSVVNTMSMFGLHCALRGALVGHFAAIEITSSPSARRMVAALESFDAAPECVRFYTEHVEADAVHEQVMRHDVVDNLLTREPDLAESVVFGIQATNLLEDRFADHVLSSWQAEHSSLRNDLDPT
ncbi:iron-containing redox enzyme family protein [Nocardia sp. CA-128927]|uniref:iron-containing redox enzyme family protein n=1 Tax=Nocardia sp. CA-128927 TaxID=3239975 RepID=UPI003D961FB0